MSKKREKSVPTVQPKQEKKLVIDMMKVERGKGPGCRTDITGSFLLPRTQRV